MDFIDGNHFDKYRSKNPIHQWLMHGFLKAITGLYDQANPLTVLEIGCGPGDLAGHLRDRVSSWADYRGIDLSSDQVTLARENYPDLLFDIADAHKLPFPDNSFDLVLACEVLEHLENPQVAINEMARVSKRWLLVSVPWEPIWRILNCARGKYLSDFGNTPGHIQHFTRRSIRSLVQSTAHIKRQSNPIPWTVLLAELTSLPESRLPTDSTNTFTDVIGNIGQDVE